MAGVNRFTFLSAGPVWTAWWVLSLAGCDAASGPAEPVAIVEVGDTTIVESHRPVDLDTARLIQVSRIGRFDGPEEFLVSNVETFTVGWRGEIYLADAGIRVFSAEGREVRRIAREGQGPGEVRFVVGMAVDASGHLLAVDLGNRRVAVFDTSGAVLDHWRLPDGRPRYGRSAIIPIPENNFLLGFHPPLAPEGARSGFPRPIFLRIDSTGRVLDTVFAPGRLEGDCPLLEKPQFRRGFWQDTREPMFPKVKWTAGFDGEVIYGCSATYRIDRVRSNGKVLRVSHLKDPVLESPGARRAFVEGYEAVENFRGTGLTWTGPEPPEQKPFFHQLIVSRDGRMFVWPAQPRVPDSVVGLGGVRYWQDPMTGAFDVFEPDGRFAGPLVLPDDVLYHWYPGGEEPFFAGDTAWVLRRDSLDVIYIDRMMIEW